MLSKKRNVHTHAHGIWVTKLQHLETSKSTEGKTQTKKGIQLWIRLLYYFTVIESLKQDYVTFTEEQPLCLQVKKYGIMLNAKIYCNSNTNGEEAGFKVC